MTADLRGYLSSLDPEREILTVDRPVSLGQELASVVKALEPAGAPGVLFTSATGSPWPVLMGTFGTRERIARALGTNPRRTLDHVAEVMAQDLPEPTVVTDAFVQQTVSTGDEVDLDAMPFATHSRDDAGRYITAGVVLARDPGTGNINTGMYRMMITGKRSITVNAAPDHDLGRIFAAARESGQKVEIAIVIGHHPAYLVASQLKNPISMDAHHLTGGLLGESLRVVRGVSVDLPIPAEAEIVLEGVVDPGDLTPEGPFGEFSYHYGKAQAPECRITAVTHRAEPIFLDLHPTHSEHLCLWLFPGRESRLLETVRRAVPGAVDARIPFHGGSFSAFVSVAKRKEGDGKQAILAALAADHFLKHVIVVDPDIDVHDTEQVLWASHVRFQADRDLVTVAGAKGIRMDPSADQFTTPIGSDTLTAKIGIDATRPLTGFPDRADLPHTGFESLDPRSYLSEEAGIEIDRILQTRRRFDE